MPRKSLLLLVCALSTVVSCTTSPDPMSKSGSQIAKDLLGTWRVVALYNDQTGEMEPIYEDGANIRIEFTALGYTVNDGCSTYSGELSATGQRLEFLYETVVAAPECSTNPDSQLNLFKATYPSIDRYHLRDDDLRLSNSEDTPRIVLVRNHR